MSILDSIEIENFRCLRKINIDNLKPITLISGKNNAGKTSLLDAVYFANKINKPDMLIQLHNSRGIRLNTLTPENLWGSFFYDRDINNSCKITEKVFGKAVKIFLQTKKNLDDSSFQVKMATNTFSSVDYPMLVTDIVSENFKASVTTTITGDSSINQSVRGNSKALPLPNVVYIDTHKQHNSNIVEYFGKIDIAGMTGQIVNVLKIIEPSIKDLSVVVIGGVSQIFALTINSEKKIPIKSMGDGINRLLEMIITIVANPNAIILIDEIENGFHYSIHQDLWKALGMAIMSVNSQLLATTHSYECISSAIQAVKDCNLTKKFEYIRIDRNRDNFILNYYDSTLLDIAVQNEMEVR